MRTCKELVVSSYRHLTAFIGASVHAPTNRQIQCLFLLTGLILIAGGTIEGAQAYSPQARYNDDRIAESVDLILTYINGTFGALIMVSAGIAAILASAFGQYRAALGLLVVAVGSFILRSLISTWFNDSTLQSR
jgi:hypothetical protein